MDARRRRQRTLADLGWRIEPAHGARRFAREMWFALRGTRSELRTVAWPSRGQALWIGGAVCAAVLGIGLLLGGVDLASAELSSALLAASR